MSDLNVGGAEAPAAAAPVVFEAPVDAPKSMSHREAARLLASLRHQKAPEPATEQHPAKAAPEPAQKSEPAQAVEDGSPAEPVPVETQEGEPDTTAIDPPRSWTKEAKERFASLPRETQEYVAERERARDGEIAKVQNEAAEARKAAEAERGKVEQARQQYERALPQLLATLESQQAGDFSDIKNIDDVGRLAREDWPRYLQWDFQQKKIAAVQQQMTAAHQQQQQERRQKFSEFARTQDKLLADKVPEMADPAKAAKLQQEAVKFMTELGFSSEELGKAWETQGDFSLRDHRVQMLLLNGMKWAQAQEKAKSIASNAKPVPQVQRPGAAQNKGAAALENIHTLEKQLETASGIKAMRLGAELTKARRAAGNLKG